MKIDSRILAAVAIAAAFALGLYVQLRGPLVGGGHEAGGAARFAGSASCASCHQAESRLWLASHHDLAMQPATDRTVLGDFANTSFAWRGVTSRFFRRNGKFLVETDGADGKPAQFEVAYTFGVAPLQQYLVAFADGRLQALPIAWDSRAQTDGGQRWFHLYPAERIAHDSDLHWTKGYQNWNFMCAECHSTGVRRNYDAARDRFATRMAELSVGCEACHGQGSRHVRWAQSGAAGQAADPSMGLLVRFDERRGASWTHDPVTGAPRRSAAPAPLRKEVETCGLCHARRTQISEDWIPGRWLSDTHLVAPLSQGLYQADGQMLDEVYNYGSFRQSRMFAAGVTCSDCHDPHSARLRIEGDGTCLQCHLAKTYGTPAHSHHAAASGAPGCVACHMPSRLYMVVDRRHDHGFRIPRPDLSMTLGTPNSCNDCHTDKPAQWAADAIARWFGPARKGLQTYGDAFRAAWSGAADAPGRLARIASDRSVPGFARAGAWNELAGHPPDEATARTGLADPDPMVRIAALDSLQAAAVERVWPLAAPLLSDPVRGVRLRAAWLLAPMPAADRPDADRAPFERAAAEFVAAQRLNADRAEARTQLGGFYLRSGMAAAADAEFKAGLRLNARYVPAAIALADLYRQLGRDGDAQSVLRATIAQAPDIAELHLSLGLTLVRLGRSDAALGELRQASALGPEQPNNAYVYAVALNSTGHAADAIATLKDSLKRHPGNRDTLVALVTFCRDAGDRASALKYAGLLAALAAGDPDIAALVESIRSPPAPLPR